MIDSYWAEKHIALKTLFNVTNKGRISMKYLIPFHMFGHWAIDVKKKSINPTSTGYVKML